jgi:transposase-like protein
MIASEIEEGFICEICGKSYPEVTPQSRMKNGKVYFRRYCKSCDYKRRAITTYNKNPSLSAVKNKAIREASNSYQIRRSGKIEDLARCIFNDCNRTDSRKHWINDLEYEWVLKTIQQPCSYCGSNNIKKSLDRIDNELAHTEKNCVCACVRCNLMRKNMPYKAWMIIVPAIKLAQESGAFGDWIGGGNTIKE